MKLRELVRAPAITCGSTTTLAEAAHLLSLHDVGSLIVLDQAGQITGIVTDRDMAVKGYGRDLPAATPVEAVMTRSLQTIDVEADSHDAANRMVNHGVRRLPVMDAGELCGVVSFDDLVMFAEDEGAILRRALAAQTRKGSPGWAGSWD